MSYIPYVPYNTASCATGPTSIVIDQNILYQEIRAKRKREEDQKTVESIFSKWATREFYYALDGCTSNKDPNNMIPIDLADIIKDWNTYKYKSNVLYDFAPNERYLMENPNFRASLYFEPLDDTETIEKKVMTFTQD